MAIYDHGKIEGKWQKEWAEKKTWKVDIDKAKNPYYNLMMFPYPSAEGLHVGNVYAFTASDIYGRFQRAQGFNVFEPIGFDSFGIHSENFAIKQGTHPKEQTEKNIKHFTEQLSRMGALFDWDRAVVASSPDYYKWTQWLFLQLYKEGLAYKGKAAVDWCPSCKTVLADEQVIDGKCERCDSVVVQKELEQWFFAITKYADRLLKNLEWIDWTEKTKLAQKNWIGRSEGAQLKFPIKGSKLAIEVFTTRPDTLFGATYMVLAPEHRLVGDLAPQIENIKAVGDYQKKTREKSELERTELNKEKSGVELQGVKAINPATKEEIPVYIADYVLSTYGTGAIMAVPAHDSRDWEFAKKYELPIINVVEGEGRDQDEAFLGEGKLVNSEKFSGMTTEKAKTEITKFVKGTKTTKYHLRDWLISRQRYWGPPIPIIYCDTCGTVPVPVKDLPVVLPEVENFRPTGTGKSPLASVESFVNTTCPECGGKATRETDVSDTFLDSAWYFLRYPSSEFEDKAFDTKRTVKWLPVNMYIGGHEHALLHLLYSRFVTMALKDMGYLEFEEPFVKFRAHGLLIKEGAKMSKSKGNVVNPDEYFARYGADTVRTYLTFLGPMADGGDWSDKGIVGIERFFNRLWKFVEGYQEPDAVSGKLEAVRAKTIKKATEDIEELHYNTAIASFMEYFNTFQKDMPSKHQLNDLLIMLAPFAPHLAEELYSKLNKGSVHEQAWPKFDEKLLKEDTVNLIIQVNGKVRETVEVDANITEQEAVKLALQQENVKKWFPEGKPKKVVFVKGKLLNLVSY